MSAKCDTTTPFDKTYSISDCKESISDTSNDSRGKNVDKIIAFKRLSQYSYLFDRVWCTKYYRDYD